MYFNFTKKTHTKDMWIIVFSIKRNVFQKCKEHFQNNLYLKDLLAQKNKKIYMLQKPLFIKVFES